MTKRLWFALLSSMALSACNGSDGNGVGDASQFDEGLPTQPFTDLADYQLSDFNLNASYAYWEVRLDQMQDEPDEVLYSYDPEALGQLDEAQQAQLDQASSESGFTGACQPAYCAIYGVAVGAEEPTLVTSKNELLGLFDGIDTEAELNVWLWANDYQGQTYEEVDGGYRVVGYWNNLCQKSGEDLLFIDANGAITVEQEISSEHDPNAPCV